MLPSAYQRSTGLPVSTAGIAWCLAARLIASRVCGSADGVRLDDAADCTVLPFLSTISSIHRVRRENRGLSRSQRTSSQPMTCLPSRVHHGFLTLRPCASIRSSARRRVSSARRRVIVTAESADPTTTWAPHSGHSPVKRMTGFASAAACPPGGSSMVPALPAAPTRVPAETGSNCHCWHDRHGTPTVPPRDYGVLRPRGLGAKYSGPAG